VARRSTYAPRPSPHLYAPPNHIGSSRSGLSRQTSVELNSPNPMYSSNIVHPRWLWPPAGQRQREFFARSALLKTTQIELSEIVAPAYPGEWRDVT